MVGFGRLAIIGIKLRTVNGSMQRNEVCAYGRFLSFRERGHAALEYKFQGEGTRGARRVL